MKPELVPYLEADAKDLAKFDKVDLLVAIQQLGDCLGLELCVATFRDTRGGVLYRGLKFRPKSLRTTNPTPPTGPRTGHRTT